VLISVKREAGENDVGLGRASGEQAKGHNGGGIIDRDGHYYSMEKEGGIDVKQPGEDLEGA
jgi:hypothetical protein